VWSGVAIDKWTSGGVAAAEGCRRRGARAPYWAWAAGGPQFISGTLWALWQGDDGVGGGVRRVGRRNVRRSSGERARQGRAALGLGKQKTCFWRGVRPREHRGRAMVAGCVWARGSRLALRLALALARCRRACVCVCVCVCVAGCVAGCGPRLAVPLATPAASSLCLAIPQRLCAEWLRACRTGSA
jgi:hypothetical protein